MKKLIIIGLDGATWDTISPLIKKDILPTFKKLIDNGSHGVLKSTIPPITGPSWLTFATGKNPGKTGVFDFLIKESIDDLNLKSVGLNYYKNHSIWDFLNSNGYKVGVVSFPTLYPLYQVNGFMVSGMKTLKDSGFTYPENLQNEIEDLIGQYEYVLNYNHPKYENMDIFFQDLNRITEKQLKMNLHLLKTKEWDFYLYVCSSTDWLQHIAWQHIDKNHYLYDAKESPNYEREFEKFFIKIDNFLKTLLKFEVNLLIISDHGFGPQDECFNLSKWLIKNKHMKLKNNKSQLRLALKSNIYRSLSRIKNKLKVNKMTIKNIQISSNRIKPRVSDYIDYDKSNAYCLGHTIPFGGIYINRKRLKNVDEYRDIKEKIIDDLFSFSKKSKHELKIEIFDPAEIYNGEKIDLAPDIIFTINNWRCIVIKDKYDKPIFIKNSFNKRHTGSHRLDGIFLAYGPDIRAGHKVDGINIYDIAPTILHMYNSPIPKEMDGKILMEIFKKDSNAFHRMPKYVDNNYYLYCTERKKIKDSINKLKKYGNI